MIVLIAASLFAVGITAFYFISINLRSYASTKSPTDLVGVLMSALGGAWFCFAALYLLLSR